MTMKPLPPPCGVFQALGSFCPLERFIPSRRLGKEAPGQSLEPALRAPVPGSEAEPWEVEMALPPSCFSHQHSQAPGQALATLTSRNNILATDSRPGLQHRHHIALSHPSPNAPQLPLPWASVVGLCVPAASMAVPRPIPTEPRVPMQTSCPQGQMGPQRPSQTPLFWGEAV